MTVASYIQAYLATGLIISEILLRYANRNPQEGPVTGSLYLIAVLLGPLFLAWALLTELNKLIGRKP